MDKTIYIGIDYDINSVNQARQIFNQLIEAENQKERTHSNDQISH